MKTFIKFSLILILAVSTQQIAAQSGVQRKADYYFSLFSYAKAIPLYEHMLERGFNTTHAHKQLAESYLLIRDFNKAMPHFEAVINNPDIPTDYYFKYAMALHSDGQIDEASKWLKKYKRHNKQDSRAKRFLEDGNFASVVFNSRERYDVTELHFNTSGSDFGSFVHQGKLYFSSTREDEGSEKLYGWNNEPWLDIFTVPEGSTSAVPKLLGGDVNSKYHESSLVFTTDYKKDTVMYFTRNNYFKNKESYGLEKDNNLKIFKAEYIDGEWKTVKSLRINSDYYSTGHPAISPDGKRLYFASDRPGGYGGTDIYYSEIHDRGGIMKPVNAGPIINTEGDEMFPFVNPEGKLFFSSDGHVGFGQLDIFSTIVDVDGNFVDVINLGRPINSSADDFSFYAEKNGINGYISSNRKGGKGSDDIYRFEFTPSLAVEGIVRDAVNNQPLDNVAISLFDQKTKEKVGETLTDENGKYRMFISRKRNYMIEAVRKTHPHKNVFFNTQDVSRSTKIKTVDIMLEPVLDVKLLAGLNKIYFDFNKSDIRPDAAQELDKVVKLMTVTYPQMIIKLEAHTDPVGSHAYNDGLSQRRAKSTYDYLIANGVPKHHILSFKGYGKRKPINECTSKEDCSPEELELNRRTEFPVIQIKGQAVNAK
ncbi:OmpA family protein [Croceitalea marina]|uniref:OmpA family protein n=1 Tax=Croceitalea marina TaxID=1775166 RepID=A0ABW5MW72_9FLAO